MSRHAGVRPGTEIEDGSVADPQSVDTLAATPTIEKNCPFDRTSTRIYRTIRDTWDVVRWTRSPGEVARAIIPLPQRWLGDRILNEGEAVAPHEKPVALSRVLRTLQNTLQCEAVVAGRVNYAALSKSEAYVALCRRSVELSHITPQDLVNDAQRKAFWLNVYNTLSLHGVIALGAKKSAMEMPSFFARVSYNVGGHNFSLNDIANGVLRRGSPRPGMRRPQFKADDARSAYCPETVDPRIHGALVCVSASCPPLAYYSPERLDEELDMAATNFVTSLVRIDEDHQQVWLPLQFYYYGQDFGGPTGVAQFLLRYLPQPERCALLRAFAEKWRFRWDAYDWGLNFAQ